MRHLPKVDPAQFLSAPGLWVGRSRAGSRRRGLDAPIPRADLIRIER